MKGKRVALVGAGSSAIQILPKIQAEVGAGHIDTYIRSSTWVGTNSRLAESVADEARIGDSHVRKRG